MNVTDLRKAFTAQGIKGFSSANRATFNAAIEAAELAAYAEKAEREAAAKPVATAAPKAPKKGICEDCGRKVGKSGHPTLCEPCYDYAGWENTHQDGHDDDEATAAACPVCHPELDPRTARKTGRSRAGMVIIAKGTEIHKSATFKAAAEAAGWAVRITVTVETVEEDGEEFELEKHTAIATKGDDTMTMVWNGRAYDYPASSMTKGGKGRKVRNLKEALRLI